MGEIIGYICLISAIGLAIATINLSTPYYEDMPKKIIALLIVPVLCVCNIFYLTNNFDFCSWGLPEWKITVVTAGSGLLCAAVFLTLFSTWYDIVDLFYPAAAITKLISSAAIVYAIASLVEWNYNPYFWHPASRFVVLVIILAVYAFRMLGDSTYPDTRDPRG